MNAFKIRNFNFSNFIKISQKRFIERPLKKKSVFQQSDNNPYHIYPIYQNFPNKPKAHHQAKFDDINYEWKALPSPVKEKREALMKLLEKEELNRIKSTGILKREKLGVGDEIEVEYYHSITKKKLYKYTGVVIGYKRPNSLTYTFRFVSIIANSTVILDYPYWTPMMASLKVIKKGTIRKRKIFNITNVRRIGTRVDELMKGGRKVNINKTTKQILNKVEAKKESITIE